MSKLIRGFGGRTLYKLLPSEEEFEKHAQKNDEVLTELNARLKALSIETANAARVKKLPRGRRLGNGHN